MARILVVDDEPGIVRFVTRALKAEGFGVDAAYDGAEGLDLALKGAYELILLDLRLPVMNGVAVLTKVLQQRPEQCVVVLSALSGVPLKVRCLEAGAADYLPKPFDLAELLARVRARLRQPGENGRHDRVLRELTAGRLRLDLLRRTADSGEGAVGLSEREFLLLQHLMERRDEVCSREELLGAVWGYSFDPGTNVVDVYVRRLRAKLGSDVITTVRNVGYCFDAA